MEENDTQSTAQYINSLVESNYQNQRICVIGPAGSGKTTLLFQLLFFHCRKYKRHVYVFDSVNKLVNTYKPIFEDICHIEVDCYNSNEIGKLEQKYLNDEMFKSHELLYTCFIIDDITDKINDGKMRNFLVKLFTTSRQMGCDVLIALHKIKLNLKIVLSNATKIFLTKLTEEAEDEFGEHIIQPNLLPICINVITGKQEFFDLSGFKGISLNLLLHRMILTDPKKFPKFVRSKTKYHGEFVEVTPKDGEREFQVPVSFKRLMNQGGTHLINKIMTNRNKIEEGEKLSVGIEDASPLLRSKPKVGGKLINKTVTKKPVKKTGSFDISSIMNKKRY